MKNILYALKNKKLQLVFLFYILLVLPLLSPLAENISGWDCFFIISANCILFCCLALLSLFCSSKAEKIIFSILLVLAIIPGIIYIAYLLFAHVLLESNSITSLFETNPEESKEFIADYLSPWVTVGVLTYALIPAIMIWRMKPAIPLKIKEHKPLFITITFIICSCLLLGLEKLPKPIYIANFYRTFISYQIRTHHEQKAFAKRQATSYEVTNTKPDSIPQTIVVVIGESLTRNHMGLYGYARPTNPLLSKRGENLFVYTDVISPQVHTIPVIRSVLSFADKENPDYITEKPTLFELFNRAGFNTHFITNQPFGGNVKTSYDVLLNLAQHKYSLNNQKKHDEVVLPVLDSILTTDTVRSKLIVIHLIGSHMAYKFRYPEKFEVFNHKKDRLVENTPFRNALAKETIDSYDNSVMYNDFIVDSVIRLLEKRPLDKTSMIYFSDHGEELYDTRNFAGHAYEKVSPYMCQIPFIVWFSDTYLNQNKETITIDTRRPSSTSDFMHSISTLAGLKYQDYDPSKSIFSAQFKPQTRYVGQKTYDEVLEIK
ncbi:heptose-I-phosphate ethanolaminephosphotransferase [Dysgonomonas sp. PH5-45]|uniref:sulfatase-like hydrolase/transferase n=1 Tax=unclassified Dysgonomonas TaxID=2630389 RepID=UPI00247694FE|nr:MULTISPECIES: sulfatase-like hydrolase/transferase [unclassified Dysgonomonas]MDH6355234.1 heptose-I-phosphate ethanolaminephosphotransferase [Dysgonomonas sp. PH5-45]MDH6388143.1 heptose-I-phosphate ethanolaminephosphotransferase [Dysgonomonas sp. PH5-37]